MYDDATARALKALLEDHTVRVFERPRSPFERFLDAHVQQPERGQGLAPYLQLARSVDFDGGRDRTMQQPLALKARSLGHSRTR